MAKYQRQPQAVGKSRRDAHFLPLRLFAYCLAPSPLPSFPYEWSSPTRGKRECRFGT
jgi:hypothetical protein